MSNEITSANLADFGSRERKLLLHLLTAWDSQGLPDDFDSKGVYPMMNKDSGCVFLTNENFDCAMMDGDKLESWYTCSNCGHEGFAEDCQINEDGCNECNPVEIENEDENGSINEVK